jgi:sterol 3beta-glucosyltransferase
MHRVRDVPVLCSFSEVVAPRPPDWPPNVHLTGYWFLDEPAWTPSPALAEFLAGGPPPVYVGFGSMVPRDPEEMFRVVRSALCRAGLRGVVSGGAWRETGRLTNAGDDALFLVEDVPHSWLFPHVAAVVHHGGAGTTAAGLRAGVPTLILWMADVQLIWGAAVKRLKVGTARRFSSATEKSLVADLRTILDPRYVTRARQLAAGMATPGESVAAAADRVEEYARLRATR